MTDTLNSSARKYANLPLSKTPAIPTTFSGDNPEYFCKAQTIASKGFVMQITKELGAYFLIPSPTDFITLRLILSKSSLLIPGLRGTPAVTIQTSASLISS